MYGVFYKNQLIKKYTFRQQCIVWCYLKGFVSYGKGTDFLQEDYKIKEMNNE